MTIRLLLPALLTILSAAPASFAEETAQRPNILFLLADDQAWNGLSVAMHPELSYSRSLRVQTPSIEKLAAQGMRFSAAYAPAPMCSPTRIALQTGRSPAALHWTRAGPSVRAGAGTKLVGPANIRALPAGERTVGEILKAAGYATAHFGKWHIEGGGPGAHGYDVHDGNLGNEHARKFGDPNPVDIFGMTERAITFMKRSRKANKPFFIQMSWHALHAPRNALKATLAKYRRLVPGANDKRIGHMALAEDLDTGVGRLLAGLEDLGLAKNTYVLYMSDNGDGGGGGKRDERPGRARGLNGGKGSLYEGGIRVPLIIRGPGVAPDSWCHVPVTGLDLLPTYAQWAGVQKLPETIEGGSFAALLANKGVGEVERPREALVFHFPHYLGMGGPQSAIRLGSFKLLKFYEEGRVALFDLAADPREQEDLSSAQPERTATLKTRLDTYLKDVRAQMPKANPQYDPSKPPQSRGRDGRRSRGK